MVEASPTTGRSVTNDGSRRQQPAVEASLLVTVAHGTRRAEGNEVARELTRLAGEALGVESIGAYVELSAPLFTEVMRELSRPAVVVPLLLSTGFHVRQDLPDAVATSSAWVTLGGPLGPDRLLAQAQVDRLRAAGATPGQPVVMAAAGSSDPSAQADLDGAVSALAEEWGGPVRLGVLGGIGQRVEDVWQPGDAVSPYLMATGFFDRRLRELLPGDTLVADVIGPHPLVVDLVVQRARALAE